ncbi:hypothetical protein ACJJI5_12335 [Microbulbifer sp. EKSA008]|uniref:hypothetical protein n=1 Tax=Microbulbifer sp. EKSA008 TaxID=3243367 RepID=UPI0040431E0F
MSIEQQPGDKLRELAQSIESVEIPAAVKMLLPGGTDLKGARSVLEQAASQLDRLDALEERIGQLENQFN